MPFGLEGRQLGVALRLCFPAALFHCRNVLADCDVGFVEPPQTWIQRANIPQTPVVQPKVSGRIMRLRRVTTALYRK